MLAMLSASDYQHRRRVAHRISKMSNTFTSIWRFERRETYGLNSRNRVSTDALNALLNWVQMDMRRSYRITQGEEDNDVMVAELNTHMNDIDAGTELEHYCLRAGVLRKRIEDADAC